MSPTAAVPYGAILASNESDAVYRFTPLAVHILYSQFLLSNIFRVVFAPFIGRSLFQFSIVCDCGDKNWTFSTV
jgi:hypothetical protein